MSTALRISGWLLVVIAALNGALTLALYSLGEGEISGLQLGTDLIMCVALILYGVASVQNANNR